MDSVLNGIQKFQKKGYSVLLDDFGSGYSSLNVLKDYDFDTIKFDMKFLHPFTAKSRKIFKYLVSMAKDLSVHTLAEGAEAKEQCDFLREIGCEKIQAAIMANRFHARTSNSTAGITTCTWRAATMPNSSTKPGSST